MEWTSLGDMAAFVAVVREGSFTAAARALGVTKQSVSERLHGLEQRIGVQLLVRSTRALHLTEVGERYYEACVDVLARAEQADRDAKAAQHTPTGTLRVTCPVALGRALLMPVIAEYQRLHPRVQFDVLLEERVIDLLKEGIDVAIRAGAVQSSSSLMARPLFDLDVVYIASTEYLARQTRWETAADLGEARCVVRRRGESWKIQGETFTPEHPLVVNTYEGALDAALAGLGVTRVPALIAHDAIQRGALRVLFAPDRRIRFTALWPARRLPAKCRALIDLLVAHARQLGATSVVA